MATRKKAVEAPEDVPAVLLADEANKSVARAKAALAKKWSLAKKESLLDAAQLGWFLVALGREREARELADLVADGVAFGTDRDAWAAASYTIALAARLARSNGDQARRASLVARLVEHPAVAATPREAFARSLADAGRDVRSAEIESSSKWACQGFARGCARAAYFCETAAEAAYEEGSVDLAALENTLAEGLAGLRAHLTR
jgi:hypothetical protein